MSYKTSVETLHTLLTGEGEYQFQGEAHDDYAIPKEGCLVGVDATTGKIKPASAYADVAAFLLEYAGVASRSVPVYSATDEKTRDRKIGVFPGAPCEFVLGGSDFEPKVFELVTPVASGGAVLNDTVAVTANAALAIGYVRQTFPLTTDIKTTTTRVKVWIKSRKLQQY